MVSFHHSSYHYLGRELEESVLCMYIVDNIDIAHMMVTMMMMMMMYEGGGRLQ